MRPILAFAAPFRWRLLGAGLLAALTEAAGLGLMATATWLLCTAAGQPPLIALSVAIVVVRTLAIGRGVLRYVERLASHDAVLRMVTEVRARIFATLVARPAAAPALRRGDLLSRMVSDVDAVQDLMVRVLLPMASAGLVGAAAVAAATFADPLVALVLAVGLLLGGAALPALAARLAARAGARLAPLRARYAVDTIDLVHGAADLAAYGARDRFEARGAAHAAELAAAERELARRAFAVDAAATVLSGATAVAVLVTGLARGVDGVWLAALTVAALATGELSLSLLMAARKSAEIRGSLHRISELLAGAEGLTPTPVPSPGTAAAARPKPAQATAGCSGPVEAEPDSSGAGRPVPEGPLTLRLVGATVRYPGAAAPALSGVDLELPPDRHIAIVGPSGSGKSTLLGLLTGAVAPQSGRAEADGVPITAYDPERWPAVVTGLLADAYLFHASVRDNLLLGRPDATDDELRTACEIAGLGEWVAVHGLDVRVGEDGAELSGGQRQRLALARAVLADPRLLLLDEPTEGLDPARADAVLAAVLAHRRGRGTVVVTHRLTGLDAFDEVVVLDAGRVHERGTQGWVRAHGG
ncbi:thiol reductant ABC exporter subunit CydC [Catellatospora tritici]|uniref:thiol reductant ABC exporter subunit CydC n=1 Tax=Catellatospora tritici TaxID=2851566 RepID=UPI001C2DB3D2|nr:thiol reductant ABC exporter subunit CydC [Catellatospora tritici]MBV1849142.1 thiol reductant ABC exporter subunit CydC [Catellatospora tritici]